MTSSRLHLDEARLAALFAPFDRVDAPGLAVGIAIDGVPVFRRGFGLANVELPIALSPTIRMRIGSTTKQFCSLAILLLVEEGKLALEESPRRHVPELPSWADPITVDQLMSHTSGMRDSLDLIMQSGGLGHPIPEGIQLEWMTQLDSVNFAAGTDWNYCNGGYLLLSEIVARASGVDFGTFLSERILRPIGMHDTLLRPLDTDYCPNSAGLHVPTAQGYDKGVFGPPIHGEGGLVSTIDDMLRWLAHMARPAVGSAASWSAMLKPRIPQGYGFGLIMDSYRGLALTRHPGGMVGCTSEMVKVPSLGLDIIVMSNTSGLAHPSRFAEQIIDSCVSDLPLLAEPLAGPPIAGDFYSKGTGRLIRLVTGADGPAIDVLGDRLPLTRDETGSLSAKRFPWHLRIRPIGKGDDVRAIDADENLVTDRLKRLALPPSQPTLHPARYAATSLPLRGSVDIGDDGGARLSITSPWSRACWALDCLGPSLWITQPNPAVPGAGGLIEIDGDGFCFSSNRTRRLRFAREACS